MDRIQHLIKEVHATGGSFTHITLDSSLSYSLDEKRYAYFWDRYCVIADEMIRSKVRLYLAEHPQMYMPLNLECRFKFNDTRIDDVVITDDYLLKLVAIIQKTINEVFELDSQKTQLTCCFLDGDHSKPERRCDYTYVNSRFHFPYCKSDAGIHTTTFLPRLLNTLHEMRFSLPEMCSNVDWKEVIVIRSNEPLPMYGSCENSTSPYYTLSNILREIQYSEIDEDSVLDHFELSKYEVIHRQHHKHLTNIMLQLDIDQMLPILLSIYYYTNITNVRPARVQPSPIRTITPSTQGETMRDIALRKFMVMIGDHRWSRPDYTFWIGRALYNVSNGSEEGLTVWKNGLLGATEPCMRAEDCDGVYWTFRDNPATERTLAWYAIEDSPDQYAEWHKQWCMHAIDEAISCLHSDVAEALYRKYWLEFACTEKGEWYYYANNQWFENNGGIDLQRRISNEFLTEYLKKIEDSARIQQNYTNDTDAFNAQQKMRKRFEDLMKKLKTNSFKTSIMKECREKFHNTYFMRFKDKNGDMIGCINGVIELFKNQAFFRRGKPEDYITFNTKIPYKDNLNERHPLVMRLNKWIDQTFTDPELRHYFCKDMASFLRGKNNEKKLRTWTGEGDNSKSMWVKCMEKALGDYLCKLPTSVMERRGQSSGAAPEMARLANRHGAILQETDSQDSINIGILKELTGGDSFFARSLHQNGGEVEATFKILLMCNKIPRIPNADNATKRRLIIIPFMSQWVHHAPATEEEQFATRKFPIDLDFEYQIPELAQALLWMMVQYYPAYCREGLNTPRIVQEHTQKYWEENDMYLVFCNEYIIRVNRPDTEILDESVGITNTELYEEFKIWYKESFPGSRIPDSSEFKQQISQRIGKQAGKKWIGYRIRQTEQPFPRV